MILLQLIFFIGILLSVQHNNKLTLKLSVILLLFSIIFNCNRENHEEVLLNDGKYVCYKGNLPKKSVIHQCNNLDNPMNINVCTNKFSTSENDNNYPYIKPCKNIGCILFYNDQNYEILSGNNLPSVYNISDDKISNIRIYKNYELQLFTGENATGERTILQAYDNNLNKDYITNCNTSSTKAKLPSLYKEYNYKPTTKQISDVPDATTPIILKNKIKSLKLVSIHDELFLEHKGITHINKATLHYIREGNTPTGDNIKCGSGDTIASRASCFNKFRDNDKNVAKYMITTTENSSPNPECLHKVTSKTNNNKYLTSMISDSMKDGESGYNTDIFKRQEESSFIQPNPYNYDIFYNKKISDETKLYTNNQKITTTGTSDQQQINCKFLSNDPNMDKTTCKLKIDSKYTVKECAKKCDIIGNECDGFQYSSANEKELSNIGRCSLLKNITLETDIQNLSKPTKNTNKNYNVYLKKNKTSAACPITSDPLFGDNCDQSKIYDKINNESSDFTKLENITVSDEVNKAKKNYRENQAHLSHMAILERHIDPANIVDIPNIGMFTDTIIIQFGNITCVSNIHVLGRLKDSTNTVDEDWALPAKTFFEDPDMSELSRNKNNLNDGDIDTSVTVENLNSMSITPNNNDTIKTNLVKLSTTANETDETDETAETKETDETDETDETNETKEINETDVIDYKDDITESSILKNKKLPFIMLKKNPTGPEKKKTSGRSYCNIYR